MASPLEVVQGFVDAFVAAWPDADADTLGPYFSEDAVYHNGPLDPVCGRLRIQATLAQFMALGGEVSVDVLHVVGSENLVMTERVDHFVIGGRTFSLPVMGIFEVADDKITAWRDYFDLNSFTSLLEASG